MASITGDEMEVLGKNTHLQCPCNQVNVQRRAHSGEKTTSPCTRSGKKKDRPPTKADRQGHQKAGRVIRT